MRTISSRLTFFYKNSIPIGLLVGLLVLITLSILRMGSVTQLQLPIIFFILTIAIPALICYRQSNPNLLVVDTVIDAGNHLIILYGKQQERIALTNILDAEYFKRSPKSRGSSWLIKLQLKTAGKFGKEISFYPSQRMGFFRLSISSHPIVEDLNTRIKNIKTVASAKNLHNIERL